MGVGIQNNAEFIVWEVLPPSLEYQNFASEARQDIEECLTVCPVKLGAIAKRLGI